MYCPKCNEDVDRSDDYCTRCGAELNAAETKKKGANRERSGHDGWEAASRQGGAYKVGRRESAADWSPLLTGFCHQNGSRGFPRLHRRKQVDVGLPATWAWFEQHRCAVDRCGEEPGGRPALRAFLCHDVGALCPGLLRAFPHLRYVVVVPCFDKGQRGRLPPPQWPNFSAPLTSSTSVALDPDFPGCVVT